MNGEPFVGAPEHQCWGKRTYLDKSEAKQAAKRTMGMHGGRRWSRTGASTVAGSTLGTRRIR